MVFRRFDPFVFFLVVQVKIEIDHFIIGKHYFTPLELFNKKIKYFSQFDNSVK